MSITSSFLGSKVRQKIISKKSKIYKNSQKKNLNQKNTKLTLKKVPSDGNQWKNALFIVNYVI
jgi:hypothetical protein